MKRIPILCALLLCAACAAGEPGSQDLEAVPTAPGPVTCPTPSPGPSPAPAPAPSAVTVVVPNALVGQIRQIAAGADGWTAIGGAQLVLDCTLSGAVVSCARYPYEPYPYEVTP